MLADTLVMGGAVSAGSTNEELVDNLCYEGYINEPSIEKVHSYLYVWLEQSRSVHVQQK